MTRAAIIGMLLAAAALGCSREEGLRCEDPSQYASSTTAPPIRVPDDLSVPNESDSLRIPDAAGAASPEAPPPQECLEAPPDYFEAEESD
jgi:uncharacterized lipoprotein